MARTKGAVGKKPLRRKDTITLPVERWQDLDDIGPSRGRAVERLIEFWKSQEVTLQ